MNKRFSTLLAAALVAGGLSAYAQTTEVTPAENAIAFKVSPVEGKLVSDRYYGLSAHGSWADNGAVTEEMDSKWIQNALALDAEGRAILVNADALTSMDAVNAGLWTIEVETIAKSNRFVLRNKVTGQTLSFNPETAVQADEDGVVTPPTKLSEIPTVDDATSDTQWTWVSAPNQVSELETSMDLKAAFKADSTMQLAMKTINGVRYLYPVKYANDKGAKKEDKNSDRTMIKLQAVVPGFVTMDADGLNTVTVPGTDVKGLALTPEKKDLIGDVISGKMFVAADVEDVAGYVTLQQAVDNKEKVYYLMQDSDVHVATGLNKDVLYKLAVKDIKKGEEGKAINTNYYFKIEKNLATDSVKVSVHSDAIKYEKQAKAVKGQYWFAPEGTTSGAAGFDVISAVKLTDKTEVMTLYTAEKPENLWFTLAEQPADPTLTSVADGVYTIQNKKGQYLAAPIYTAKNATEAKAEWVTVNAAEQNVLDMPAYQWVVLKNKTSEKYAATSPVTVVNREYPEVTPESVNGQLRKEDAAAKYLHIGDDSLAFTAVPAKILADSLVGYKYTDAKEDARLNRYTFNYLHPYATDKYLAKSEKDSVATVLVGKQKFAIVPSAELEAYGYEVTKAVEKRIPDLKQLYRQSYTVYVPAVKDANLGVNAEGKYVITDNVAAATFYFKENNEVEGTCYYALVNITDEKEYTKAGVTDDDLSATLKNIVYTEKRTSAFSIKPADAPLYRRFNNAALNEDDGKAQFFAFVENVRGEYLMDESNANLLVDNNAIDFAGIWTANKAKGLAFQLDSVVIGRNNGTLKPQYLVSVAHNDYIGRDGVPCTETSKHFDINGKEVDAAHCIHATQGAKGFVRAKYLVNFADSVAKAANKEDYTYVKYTRVGFVEAIVCGDSLMYVLPEAYRALENDKIDLAKLAKDVKAIDLRSEDNSNVKWSFRYVDPEVAGTAAEEGAANAFLLESSDDVEPVAGAYWVKMQNGCVVMTDETSTFDNAKTGGDGALIFNVEPKTAEELATSNEAIAASEVSVVAGEGVVTIAGAAGKKVVITNILGQTVANTVITSDNATVAAPAGVVVVAVEGEAAVKAVVK